MVPALATKLGFQYWLFDSESSTKSQPKYYNVNRNQKTFKAPKSDEDLYQIAKGIYELEKKAGLGPPYSIGLKTWKMYNKRRKSSDPNIPSDAAWGKLQAETTKKTGEV